MSIDQWPKKTKDFLKNNAKKIGVAAATVGTLMTAPENKAGAQGPSFNSIYRPPQTGQERHVKLEIGHHDFYPGQDVPSWNTETTWEAAEIAMKHIINEATPLHGGFQERNAIMINNWGMLLFYYDHGTWAVEKIQDRRNVNYQTGMTRVYVVKTIY